MPAPPPASRLADSVPLPRLLTQPETASDLTTAEWDQLLRDGRATGMLARLTWRLKDAGQFESLPASVQVPLESSLLAPARNRQWVHWELRQLTRALAPLNTPVILLKGAAYVAADLPPARGRRSADIDLLVPQDKLTAVEQALRGLGWSPKPIHPFHQRYFRRWLHELPPLIHAQRQTELDVHHSILPRTDRLHTDGALLFAESRPFPESIFRILAPADMVLHAAAHLFRNGDYSRGLSDLADLDDLLREFSATEPDFWNTLLHRATQLRLQTPCYFGLRYTARLLNTPVPEDVHSKTQTWRPAAPPVALMDRLVTTAVLPVTDPRYARRRERALQLLAYYPLPRLRAVLSPVFWLKRGR